MSDATALIKRLFDEGVNQGRTEVFDEIYAPDFVDRAPGPAQPPGVAGIVEVVKRYRAAIPDLEITIEDVIVADGRIITRETWRGTHEKELAGIPASGERFEMTRMHIFRINDGRVVEEWTAGSVLDALRV